MSDLSLCCEGEKEDCWHLGCLVESILSMEEGMQKKESEEKEKGEKSQQDWGRFLMFIARPTSRHKALLQCHSSPTSGLTPQSWDNPWIASRAW
jgi:hypothetical protein